MAVNIPTSDRQRTAALMAKVVDTMEQIHGPGSEPALQGLYALFADQGFSFTNPWWPPSSFRGRPSSPR
jgi:hypothetical protein